MSKVLVPIILLLSSVGLYFSYISPTYESYKQYKAIEQRLVDAMTTFDNFENKKSILTQQYSEMKQSDLERLKRMLPDSIDPVRVIIDIDTTASLYNLNIKTFTLPSSETQTPSAYATQEVETPVAEYASESFMISLTGTYQDFKNFLTRIESDLTLMDVTQLGLDATGETEETIPGNYVYEMAFKTYKLQ